VFSKTGLIQAIYPAWGLAHCPHGYASNAVTIEDEGRLLLDVDLGAGRIVPGIADACVERRRD